MPIDPFKSTAYQVGRIVRALTSDSDGNLIFRDVPNPDGVTLTELLKGLIGSNVSFDAGDSFFVGVDNIQEALEYLNQFAYLKYTSRFIYVDSTIPDNFVVPGEIYNNVAEAVAFAQTLTFNGYNSVNLMIMGMHKEIASEAVSDAGVFELDVNTPININSNGLKFIGIGNPVFRIKDSNPTSTARNEIFKIQNNSDNKVSVLFQDISFEFVDSIRTSAIRITNSPSSGETIERNGVKLINSTVSFNGGTNIFNRFIDFRNSDVTDRLDSEVFIDGLKVGSISGVTSSTDPIELIYMDHSNNSLLTVKDLNLAAKEQPNPSSNTSSSNVTAFVAVNALNGKVILSETILDEKFFWNGNLVSGVTTRMLNADGSNTRVSVFNAGIVRDSYNTQNEDTTGTTLIRDWINVTNNARVNVVGSVDERYDVDVQTIPVTSTGTTGTTGTTGSSGGPSTVYSVKPLKSFWNKDDIIFGLGNRQEVRFGIPTQDDIMNYLSQYDISEYGIPFWYNENIKGFQFFDGTQRRTLGEGSGGNGLGDSVAIASGDWSATSYVYDGGPTFLGFEYVWTHNLSLTNAYAFSYTLFDTTNGNQVQAQQIEPVSNNQVKIIVASPFDARFTLVGF
jgi:hypothetical protein